MNPTRSKNQVYVSHNCLSKKSILLTRNYIPFKNNPKITLKSYLVLDRNYFSLNDRSTKIINMDESWDFPLQTLFDDSELFQYYLFCCCKSLKLNGIILRRIDDEMVKMLHNELEDIISEVHSNEEL